MTMSRDGTATVGVVFKPNVATRPHADSAAMAACLPSSLARAPRSKRPLLPLPPHAQTTTQLAPAASASDGRHLFYFDFTLDSSRDDGKRVAVYHKRTVNRPGGPTRLRLHADGVSYPEFIQPQHIAAAGQRVATLGQGKPATARCENNSSC